MNPIVAIVGYGRFGGAVGERLLEDGRCVRAWDPESPPPPEIAAPTPARALADSSIVLLTVPVPRTEAALRELRPHLRPDQLLIEAGSVKTGPTAILEKLLGREIPWAATHPLFGPVSLALDERPLRCILCPNALHPEAVAAAGAFWRGIGCETLEMDPESHDERMARTHAVAFFLAKGVLDCGFLPASEWVPPSVHGLERTVRSTIADAGQLLATLNRDNPYAPRARACLLEALGRLDAALRAPIPADEEPHHESPELRIEDPGWTPPQLQELRERIDGIDREILRLMASRTALAVRAGRTKAAAGRGVRDLEREDLLLTERKREAARLGIDSEAAAEVFRALMDLSRRHQARARRPSPME